MALFLGALSGSQIGPGTILGVVFHELRSSLYWWLQHHPESPYIFVAMGRSPLWISLGLTEDARRNLVRFERDDAVRILKASPGEFPTGDIC